MNAIIKIAYMGTGKQTRIRLDHFRKSIKMATGVLTNRAAENYLKLLEEFGMVKSDMDYVVLTEKTCKDLGIISDPIPKEELDEIEKINQALTGGNNDTNEAGNLSEDQRSEEGERESGTREKEGSDSL